MPSSHAPPWLAAWATQRLLTHTPVLQAFPSAVHSEEFVHGIVFAALGVLGMVTRLVAPSGNRPMGTSLVCVAYVSESISANSFSEVSNRPICSPVLSRLKFVCRGPWEGWLSHQKTRCPPGGMVTPEGISYCAGNPSASVRYMPLMSTVVLEGL